MYVRGIGAGVDPDAVDGPAEALLDADSPLRLVMDREGVLAELTRTEAAAILALLDESFPIRAARTGLLVMSPNRRSEIGKIKIGKTRISLQKLLLQIGRAHV